MTERSSTPITPGNPPAVVVLVTDVGGSVALHEILTELPADYSIPIVVLQPAQTVLIEANIAALQRTVPFALEMLNESANLCSRTVYVGRAEESYAIIRENDLLRIHQCEPTKATWRTGQSLRQFADVLGTDMTVAFLSTQFSGFDLEQLLSDLWQHVVTLAFVTAAMPRRGLRFNAGTAPPIKELANVGAVADFLFHQITDRGAPVERGSQRRRA